MSIDEIIVRLRQSGHKVTPQRLQIVKTVMESSEHLTPTALYERLHQADSEIGQVTIYRTLNILSELGLVCMIHTGENTHGYISRPPEHHDHLICSECGKVINFTNCNVSELEKKLVSETGFKIKEHHLEFYGNCPDCTDKGAINNGRVGN